MPSNKKRLFPEDGANFTPLNSGRCPLCAGPNASFGLWSLGEQRKIFQGWCPACTNVRITQEANEEVKRRGKAHLLSAALRQLPADRWKEEVDFAVEVATIDKLISSVTELEFLDQFDRTLKLICDMCPVVGQRSTFDYMQDWPLIVAPLPDTALFILRQLAQMDYIERGAGGVPLMPSQPTWKAYERLQQIQASGKNSQFGFVAMSFQPDQNVVWQTVMEPGIQDAGYKPIRVDKYEHSNRIDDEIIAQVRRSRFLVADFTLQRNGVYFEAGFAQGLGRTVIFMCRESDKQNLHFDTRQYNHIFYEDLEKARAALTHRIVALEGQGPLKSVS
jgi:nucleoside 2-deoxyribosyltransferase